MAHKKKSKKKYGFERYNALADVDGGPDGLTLLERAIMLYLCRRADWDTGCLLKRVYARDIADHLCCHVRSVQNCITILKKTGWLTMVPNPKGNPRTEREKQRKVLELTRIKALYDVARKQKKQEPRSKEPDTTPQKKEGMIARALRERNKRA